jgi:threonylcarbamoyladenosine tRNA methylthiotransferase MtaB
MPETMPETMPEKMPETTKGREAGPGPEILTFGCRLNIYESEVMRRHAEAGGEAERLVIVNTCAVTAEAVRQAGQAIRKARRERPDARIIVTGCAAQIEPERFAAMPEVDQVLGNAEKLMAASFAPAPAADFGIASDERVRVGDIMSVHETAGHLVAGFESRARAFLQVQNGCDHRCTFCIIPFGRGPSRSVPMGAITEQARALVAAGHRELVLSGVALTSYGHDLPGRPALGDLARRLLEAVPELPRLRLSSLDAVEADPALFRLIETEPRLMPHLHLSLQAGDDLVLKRMKRRHLRADAVAFAARVREARPDVALGADFITGFPTETEAMFRRTLDLVEECGLVWLHVFPYSPRPGTPAARMPQVPGDIARDRARRLRSAGSAALARYLDTEVGMVRDVLVERPGEGRTPQFAPVSLTGPAASLAAGSILAARITAAGDGRLVAEAA